MPSDALSRLAGGQGAPAGGAAPAPAAGGGSDALARLASRTSEQADPRVSPDETPTEDSGMGGLGAGIAGVAGLAGAAALAARNPGMLSKAFKYGNAARMQLMLSGYAAPKSILGNVGSSVIASAERGSLDPLKAFFSRQTLQDVKSAYKSGVQGIPGANLPGPTPGRIMGAFDEATQKAHVRGGLTAEEAEKQVLQTPLTKERVGVLGDVLNSPVAHAVIPFRRTPINQFVEGLDILKNPGRNPKTLGAVAAAGAAHGAATSDTPYPKSIPLATAAAGRYSLPYALSALVGRKVLGGGKTGGGIASGALPVSEYGIEQSVTNPLKPFVDPAMVAAIRNLGK